MALLHMKVALLKPNYDIAFPAGTSRLGSIVTIDVFVQDGINRSKISSALDNS